MIVQLHSLGQALIQTARARLGPDSELLFANLLYMVSERGKRIPRERLLELFWPGSDDRAGRHCLRQTVYRLRQYGVPIESSPTDVELPADTAAADYDPLLDPRGATDAIPADALRGEYLPHYAPDFSPAFSEWVEQQRSRIHSQLRRALLAEITRLRGEARWGEVERLARQVLDLDALNEEATLALAEATAFAGAKAEALGILDRYLQEIGTRNQDIRIPATVLRRRIAERIPQPTYVTAADACFVGREEDMAFLSSLLQNVRAGESRACLIWGEAGIGKTRLLAEFAKVAALQGAAVQRVACQPTDAKRPMSVFVDLVPLLLGMPGALGCSPEAMAHLTKLTGHAPYTADSRSTGGEAETLWAVMRQSVSDLLDAILSEQPVVLLLEDVHWIDDASLKLLGHLLLHHRGQRLMFVLTARPSGPRAEVPLAAMLASVPIRRLKPLPSRVSASLLDALTKPARKAMSAEEREWCISVSEGRPYFLSELAAHWLRTGRTTPAPASLTEMLAARITGLTRHASQALHASSILAKNATISRIERLLDLGPSELLAALEELEAAGLVSTQENVISPRHDLVAEAAEDSLGQAPRRLLHLRAARLLDAEMEATRSAAILWDCVQHYQRSGERERVIALVRQYASHLQNIGLPVEALNLLRRTHDICTTPEDRLRILEAMSSSLVLTTQFRELISTIHAKTELRRQLHTASDGHDDDELVLLHALWRTGHDLRSLLEAACRCAQSPTATSEHRLRAAMWALILADNLGSKPEMDRIYSQSRELIEHPRADPADAAFAQLVYHSSAGDLDAGIAAGERLVAHHRRDGQVHHLSRALKGLNIPLRRAGRIEEACRVSEEAFHFAEKYNLASPAIAAADQIAWTLLDIGDVTNARHWHHRMMKWRSALDDCVNAFSADSVTARIAAIDGNYELAEQLGLLRDAALADTCGRQRVGALTFWALLRAKRQPGCEVEQHRLDDFIQLHRDLRGMGNHDYAASALFLLLERIGRTDEAAALRNEYLKVHRRERFAPALFLTHSSPA